jgi:biotin--protein ligase
VRITGLSPSGFLAAVDADGDGVNRYELHPDGNSLDFFAGLVRKKAAPPPRGA